jgi:hypothetical protein
VDLKKSDKKYLISVLPSAEAASSGKKKETWGWANARSVGAGKESIGCRMSNVQLICGAENNEQKKFISKAGSIAPSDKNPGGEEYFQQRIGP